ncbi:hypothetical protein CDD81_5765 [Ophiocordyceps australis]|uniref:Uncharacterized protein n=1 Tax=Ophiocordyceps australis TaxID=1399860 RepID=A0A2C5Y945_9HYPO|nr:hypothetical protein CDD81_5765 [Ophiocordyceps australis]
MTGSEGAAAVALAACFMAVYAGAARWVMKRLSSAEERWAETTTTTTTTTTTSSNSKRTRIAVGAVFGATVALAVLVAQLVLAEVLQADASPPRSTALDVSVAALVILIIGLVPSLQSYALTRGRIPRLLMLSAWLAAWCG